MSTPPPAPGDRSEPPILASAEPEPGGPARAFWRSLSGPGLLIGAAFFAASLTPSLIPRGFLMQGILAGLCFAIGYGAGVLLTAIWTLLHLPVLRHGRHRQLAHWAAALVALVIIGGYALRAAEWQNSIRARMTLPPVESVRPLEVALIALILFALLVLLWRASGKVSRPFRSWLARHLPERAALVLGFVLILALLAFLTNRLVLTASLRLADGVFAAVDALIEPKFTPPTGSERTGSAASLIAWEDLGRAGREFVASGPTREDLAAFLGRSALQPLRVYVGLNAAEDEEARARLALRELIRVGAFDRAVLVVAVPTGSGWMDPAATDTVEYLHAGDTAIVAVQYSYLASPLSLLFEPGFAMESGRSLFRAVYRHWTGLPEHRRPRLYLFGLSLGAYGSEQSSRLHEVLADPYHGALWAGPPFPTPGWRAVTLDRNPDSPEWLPTYGDGSIVRFTNQENALDLPGARWGPMRIVYLQYASDPVTFFSPSTFYRKPDWMNEPVGPDVSPDLRWYPVVTGLQLALDMAVGLDVPIGFGHYFAPEHYIDAWMAVSAPSGWTPEELERLKARFIDGRSGG